MNQDKNNNGNTNFKASVALLVMLSALEIFHLLILAGLIPYDFIWGGKLKSSSQMFLFETISVIINSVMIVIVALNTGYARSGIQPGIIKVALWAMFILFMLNSLGNIISENPFEKYVFTPVTLMVSLLCFILIRTKRSNKINIIK